MTFRGKVLGLIVLMNISTTGQGAHNASMNDIKIGCACNKNKTSIKWIQYQLTKEKWNYLKQKLPPVPKKTPNIKNRKLVKF